MALFEPGFGLIFWMLVVFLVIFGILARYAWPVIIKSIEERAEFIESGVKYTQEALIQKKQAETDAHALLADARKRQVEVLREAERMKQEIIADAKIAANAEAQKVLEGAKLSVEQMKKEAQMQIRKRVVGLSLEIAEKVIRKNLSGDRQQEEMVDKLLEEMNV